MALLGARTAARVRLSHCLRYHADFMKKAKAAPRRAPLSQGLSFGNGSCLVAYQDGSVQRRDVDGDRHISRTVTLQMDSTFLIRAVQITLKLTPQPAFTFLTMSECSRASECNIVFCSAPSACPGPLFAANTCKHCSQKPLYPRKPRMSNRGCVFLGVCFPAFNNNCFSADCADHKDEMNRRGACSPSRSAAPANTHVACRATARRSCPTSSRCHAHRGQIHLFT